MGKGRAAGAQLGNHVISGIACGIAQTAVVCVESPGIISITACPLNLYVRILFAFTYHIPVHTAVLTFSLIYSKGTAAYF